MFLKVSTPVPFYKIKTLKKMLQ